MTNILYCDRGNAAGECPECEEHFDFVYEKIALMQRISFNDLLLEFIGHELIPVLKPNGKRRKKVRAIRGVNGCTVSATYRSDTETKLYCACR